MLNCTITENYINICNTNHSLNIIRFRSGRDQLYYKTLRGLLDLITARQNYHLIMNLNKVGYRQQILLRLVFIKSKVFCFQTLLKKVIVRNGQLNCYHNQQALNIFFRLQIASVFNYYCRKDGKSMCFARYKRRAFQGCNRKT